MNRSLLKAGGYGAETRTNTNSINGYQKPKHWTEFDIDLIRDFYVNTKAVPSQTIEFRLDGRHGSRLLEEALRSGSAIWTDLKELRLGASRAGRFQWDSINKSGQVSPRVQTGGGEIVLAAAVPWYVDLDSRESGPIDFDVSASTISPLLRIGTIPAENLALVRQRLQEIGIPEKLLPPDPMPIVVRAPQPSVRLSIDFEACLAKHYYYSTPEPSSAPIAFANLRFEYEGNQAHSNGEDIRLLGEDEIVLLKRNHAAERIARDAMKSWGWLETSQCSYSIPAQRKSSLCIAPNDHRNPLEPLAKIRNFASRVVPELISHGWQVELEENIRLVPNESVDWDISLESPAGIDWFQFNLGIRVDGEPFDLRTVLALLSKEPGWADSKQNSGELLVFGPNGKVFKLSKQRLSAILKPLLELFGGFTEWPDELRLPKTHLAEISKFEKGVAEADVPWKTSEEVGRLNQLFKNFDRLEPCQEPSTFKGELRHYQREGLAWLQFLRDFEFGGVLADDMGLGKTVQVLAHIQIEKEAGRLDRPCLIVAPTSTIPNWKRECEKFAPELRVVALQGLGRAAKFSDIGKADIALTTYPLLARDQSNLAKFDYHLLVLDEAQNIKNPVTAAAKAARAFNARHRVCLSGTPVENHLGELWSLFHFLMPGFLGTETHFRRTFRTPIEKTGEPTAKERLARRIRPFMLRRTKNQVLSELPPKTEIIETIEFGEAQSDLYESIRVAMDKQVRDLIAAQGFDKSTIQILDALLKLRQVCCDPRLVKLPSAKLVTESAKLSRLMEMLSMLLEDGRKVILFSQFTSMLDLIETRLKEENVPWVRISGDTTDRETPVRRFQAGEVPLFLISLKAGGVGLNLTAADTVILYDPWWNPAVENQAIDRAHRMAQDKPVAVYRLVTAGTIEEKMIELQARKGALARSILADDAESVQSLTADDLRWVLSKD